MSNEGRKLFIGIPVYGGIVPQFMECMAAFIAARPIPARIRMKHGDSLVTRARNALTAEFLESDCTHLLFIDSDLVFTVDDVVRIAGHELDLVGGMYPLKREGDVQWCGNGLLAERPPARSGAPASGGPGSGISNSESQISNLKSQREGLREGVEEVRYIGTGFMCISRHVLTTMLLADGQDITYQSDSPPHKTEYDFWRVGVRVTGDVRRRYLSEDWYFCQRWIELGGKVYADKEVVLRHVGQATFPLESQRAAMEVSAENEENPKSEISNLKGPGGQGEEVAT